MSMSKIIKVFVVAAVLGQSAYAASPDWSGSGCSGANCSAWNSAGGESWTCASAVPGSGTCAEWRSSAGASWTCEVSAAGTGGCLLWKSGEGRYLPAACDKNGCKPSGDKRPDVFMPSFMQLAKDYPSRAVEFSKAVPTWDENGYGWVACSEKDQRWQFTEDTWRTERKEGWEIYVCRYIVTYDCRWKNCNRPYPNTEPDSCACKVSCRDSAQKTNDCHWEQIQAE